jgi:hypothetical protein
MKKGEKKRENNRGVEPNWDNCMHIWKSHNKKLCTTKIKRDKYG